MGLPTGSQYISYIGMAWMMPDGRAQIIIVFERDWGRLQNTSQKKSYWNIIGCKNNQTARTFFGVLKACMKCSKVPSCNDTISLRHCKF